MYRTLVKSTCKPCKRIGYIYAGSQSVGEIRNQQLSHSLMTGLQLDEQIARIALNQGATPQLKTMLTDALGSVIAIAKADQSLEVGYAYSPYGQTQKVGVENQQIGSENNSQYTGRESDQNGLYYYRARYYDPVLKRFISEDPIGLAGGINSHAYVDGDPVSGTDPSGLKTAMCTKPLHALGGTGARSGWDIPGNPLYHQYACVSDGKGGMTCGGQDQRGKKWYDPINGPGKPSDDKYNPQSCKDVEPDNKCIESCLVDKFAGPRPRYGIPFGTDCQEWADNALESCRNKCDSSDMKRPYIGYPRP